MSQVNSSTSRVDPWHSAFSPDPCSSADLSGACALLVVLIQAQSATQSGARTDIDLGFKKLEELKKQLADALQQAKEAAQHSSFFGLLGKVFGSDIATVAGAVASAAAVLATGGAAAPVLLLSLSAALQLGAKVGAELGLDPKLCAALSLGSVAVGLFSGSGTTQACSAFADGMRVTSAAGQISQAAATATGAVLNHRAAHFHADDLRHQADAVGYRASDAATQISLDDAFALLERALRTEHAELSTASELVQHNAETAATLSERM